jgi:hypothetical protein
MLSANRVASRFLLASYFNVGDYISFGKFKNKRGKVVKMYLDLRGIPYIEIQPIPKGRKKNRVLGLYTIRKMSPEAIVEAQVLEKAGE